MARRRPRRTRPPAVAITEPFDLIVCAGNVLTFLAPDTRRTVLQGLAAHLAPKGRLITGFGAGRDYSFTEFLDDAEQAGLAAELLLASWDLRHFNRDGDFLVAVFSLSAS